MGFLDKVKGALRGDVSTRESKTDTAEAPTTAPTPPAAPAPTPTGTASKVTPPAPAPAAPAPVAEKPGPEYDTYTVQTGDTIGSICAKVGISYQQITTINKIENPDLIYPGQVFQIPKKK